MYGDHKNTTDLMLEHGPSTPSKQLELHYAWEIKWLAPLNFCTTIKICALLIFAHHRKLHWNLIQVFQFDSCTNSIPTAFCMLTVLRLWNKNFSLLNCAWYPPFNFHTPLLCNPASFNVRAGYVHKNQRGMR